MRASVLTLLIVLNSACDRAATSESIDRSPRIMPCSFEFPCLLNETFREERVNSYRTPQNRSCGLCNEQEYYLPYTDILNFSFQWGYALILSTKVSTFDQGANSEDNGIVQKKVLVKILAKVPVEAGWEFSFGIGGKGEY